MAASAPAPPPPPAAAEAAPPASPQKYLSYSAILVLAANTMNGPGITTLPDVAADAGRALFASLIAVSVAMAAFVCRRMVYAMWSSIEGSGDGGDDEEEGYETMKKVESGLVQSLSMDGGGGVDGEEASTDVRETDEIMPEAVVESPLIHRDHDHKHAHGADGGAATPAAEAASSPSKARHTEDESLLSHKDHDENMAAIAGGYDGGGGTARGRRPVLEHTSIVGQSREAYGRRASVYTAFTMVASALCLGLAQMVRSFLPIGFIICTLFEPLVINDT